MAYVNRFGDARGIRFVGFFLGSLHVLPLQLTASYLRSLEQAWQSSSRGGRVKTASKAIVIYVFLLALCSVAWVGKRRGGAEPGAVYLNLSHQNLTARRAIAAFKSRIGARLLCFVHDLIPITHPEYARPGQAAVHRRRMDTVFALADVILVNSAATREALLRHAGDGARLPEIHVAHLGIGPIGQPAMKRDPDDTAATPYFLMLATIEPRKNHLLLLHLWRGLAAQQASQPRLIIVGRRGWENEMVLDMLDRCKSIGALVEERRDLSDAALGPLLRGAAALLLPSFAEGFGLPVAEALATGTPVICSDLPALREIGGDVPEYIDPMDGPAWRQAICAYAEPSSARRQAQCIRLRSWTAPSWEGHFGQVSAILENLMRADAISCRGAVPAQIVPEPKHQTAG